MHDIGRSPVRMPKWLLAPTPSKRPTTILQTDRAQAATALVCQNTIQQQLNGLISLIFLVNCVKVRREQSIEELIFPFADPFNKTPFLPQTRRKLSDGVVAVDWRPRRLSADVSREAIRGGAVRRSVDVLGLLRAGLGNWLPALSLKVEKVLRKDDRVTLNCSAFSLISRRLSKFNGRKSEQRVALAESCLWYLLAAREAPVHGSVSRKLRALRSVIESAVNAPKSAVPSRRESRRSNFNANFAAPFADSLPSVEPTDIKQTFPTESFKKAQRQFTAAGQSPKLPPSKQSTLKSPKLEFCAPDSSKAHKCPKQGSEAKGTVKFPSPEKRPRTDAEPPKKQSVDESAVETKRFFNSKTGSGVRKATESSKEGLSAVANNLAARFSSLEVVAVQREAEAAGSRPGSESKGPEKPKSAGPVKIEMMVSRSSINSSIETVLGKAVSELNDELAANAALMKEARSRLKQQIQELLLTTFPQFKCELGSYGSCVTGLTTPFSDMDLCIKTVPQVPRAEANGFLSKLATGLSRLSCFTAVKHIETASVPVVKVTAPLEGPQTTSVDLTVETAEESQSLSTAFRTTRFVCGCVESYPSFKPVVLFVKFAMNRAGLADSYRGGLNAFGLSLLYLAFLHTKRCELSLNVGRLTRDFLRFLTAEFDPLRQAVCFRFGYE